jgi:hypothetical protein
LRWVPLPGGRGEATGAIAIGTAATSTSTTTIISIETPTGTSTVAKLARATNGSTIRNIVVMRLTVTVEQRIGSVAMRASSRAAELEIARVASGEPVAREELAELAVQEAREALAELAVQEAREALAELAVQEAREALAELAVQEAREALAELVVQVVVPELVLGHQRGLLAVALRTKSVTAVHRRGQVAALAVEDLAEVAETTREPAATEAAAAWEAAVTAVAAVVAVAVE